MKRLAVSMAIAIAVTTVAAQEQQDPSALLQAARIKEAVQNDLPEAIALYERAVRAAAADRSVAPTALLGLARAYERAGRGDARATYLRIVNDYPDATAPAATARERLAALQHSDSGPFRETNLHADVRPGRSPVVSPDGRAIAFLDWRPGVALYVRDLASGRERRLTEARQGEAISQQLLWSPNSQHVAFLAVFDSAKGEGRVVSVSNGRVTTVRSWSRMRSPFFDVAWSPDSARLLVGSPGEAQAPWQFELVTLGTGQGQRLPPSSGPPSAARWSPDGNQLVYRAEQPASLLVVTTAGEERRSIAAVSAQANTAVLPARWTPDNRIVFSQNVPGGTDWYVVPAAGGEPRRICEARAPLGGDGCGAISPDGVWQITRQNRTGGGRIVLRSTVDGKERTLTPDAVFEEAPRGLGFSPDGRLLAFRSNREGPWAIYVVALSQPLSAKPIKVVQLESPETRIVASWTSRGLVVQMTNTQSHLYRLDFNAAGGTLADVPVRITKEGGTHTDPLVSPDASRVAFTTLPGPAGAMTPKSLTIVDANGANQRIVGTIVGSLLGWHSSTELLLAHSPASSGPPAPQQWLLSTVDAATGQVTALALPPLAGWGLQYAAGTDEVFSYAPGGRELQVTSVKTGATRVIEMPATWFDYTVSRSGRFLAYSTADFGPDGKRQPVPGETRLRNLVTGEDRLVVKYADSDSESHMTVEFSGDDKFLVYQQPSGREWRVMNLDTLQSRALPRVQGLNLPLDGTEPSWSPDNRFVVLGGRMPREALRLFELSADSVARAVAAGRR